MTEEQRTISVWTDEGYLMLPIQEGSELDNAKRTLRKQAYLSPAYEAIKAHRDEYAAEHSGAHTMGYLQAMDWCLRAMEDHAAEPPVQYLRRPTKPVFKFESEGNSD